MRGGKTMLRYYKLFDLLFRKNMKLNDLKEILSSATIAKLRKGEYISGEALDKMCEFLQCQPEDIIEHYRAHDISENYQRLVAVKTLKELNNYGEEIPIKIHVHDIKEPLNDKGQPVHGWYERELLDDYKELDYWDKCQIDYENARINKEIYDTISKYYPNDNIENET